ncbi:MAG: hypothetical protein A2096_04435 [Spirochaetes bacterium GWF1_41_5]|nr:MAG: hypothetical protein A2096_04435 [Spirochaetes bacterium GWF1_41_5]HBE03559.1 permease [Spirochaetia bacterium]
MKKITGLLKEYVIILIFLPALAAGHFFGFAPADAIWKNFTDFFLEMIRFLPLMFILVGLFDAWAPREKIQKLIGEGSRLQGTVLVIMLAMLQAGPLYGAFPVAYVLWKKGCSIKNIFIYLGAFSTIKLPMLSFEIKFMGLEFSLVRSFVSLAVFIAIGYIMEILLKNSNFSVQLPENNRQKTDAKIAD